MTSCTCGSSTAAHETNVAEGGYPYLKMASRSWTEAAISSCACQPLSLSFVASNAGGPPGANPDGPGWAPQAPLSMPSDGACNVLPSEAALLDGALECVSGIIAPNAGTLDIVAAVEEDRESRPGMGAGDPRPLAGPFFTFTKRHTLSRCTTSSEPKYPSSSTKSLEDLPCQYRQRRQAVRRPAAPAGVRNSGHCTSKYTALRQR